MPLAFTTGTSSYPRNKRKFEIQVFLLLYVLIPGTMSSLDTINPWLSACDLKQEIKGSCTAPKQFPTSTTPDPDAELFCPDECSAAEGYTRKSTCLPYVNDRLKKVICNFSLRGGVGWLNSFLKTLRLKHCCEYRVLEALSGPLLQKVYLGKDQCYRVIDNLVEVDNLAGRVTCEFASVLSRYDCGQPYSVKFSCNDCLEAYRRWICSTLIPYFNETVRIRPCRSVCQAVEQKCPYFLPENKAPTLPTQYAGEPTFLCMDPNIPETGNQYKKSLYPDDSTCCVKICGKLKNGFCLENECKKEELVPYEEALDQIVECYSTDLTPTRAPNPECTASEPYNSPHNLGSGVRRTLPRPALVFASACVNHSHAREFTSLILLLLCFCFTSSYLPCLLAFTAIAKLFFNFVKRTCFVLYELSSFKKRQYTISSMLSTGSATEKLFILMTRRDTMHGELLKARRARLFYYFYYIFTRRYTILSGIAQNSINFLNLKRFCDVQFGRFNLIPIRSFYDKKLISSSAATNPIQFRSCICKVVIVIRTKRGIADATNRGLTELNEAVVASGSRCRFPSGERGQVREPTGAEITELIFKVFMPDMLVEMWF